MSHFHNPYHFAPLESGAPPDALPLKEIPGTPRLTHDRDVPGTFSGKLICRITVETPLLIGNRQEDRADEKKVPSARHQPKLLHPFTANNDGTTPVLPASSLRGMISALAEAATRSSLRILENTALSHRVPAGERALSAIGLLVMAPDGPRLQPLTLPTLPRANLNIAEEWRVMFPSGNSQPLLKAYVDGYAKQGQTVGIRSHTFLDSKKPNSFSPELQEFWYARLPSPPSLTGHQLHCPSPRYDSRTTSWLIGQDMVNGAPISEADWAKLPDTERPLHTRGILRVLGLGNGDRKDMPAGKKHEIFIPYPPGSGGLPAFPCESALRQFHALADERTADDARLPFSVQGSDRNDGSAGLKHKLRLRPGDLVFFRPNGQGTEVEEIAVSSIWRAGNGTVHQYFANVSPELLPFSPRRTTLSLAEQLFGVVEERPKDPARKPSPAEKKEALTLAGRLRFSDALLHTSPSGGVWQPVRELLSPEQNRAMAALKWTDYPLQNLASPKPPSPALYFKASNGAGEYIAKGGLQPGGKKSPTPQGRKFYLRRNDPAGVCGDRLFAHPSRLRSHEDLQGIIRQHQCVEKFVRPGSVFFFQIDFDNLTEQELSILAWALSPDGSFRHQAGHGKPLGLGQIHLQPVGLLTVDRRQRYGRDALNAPRWHSLHATTPEEWPAALRPDGTGLPSFEDKLTTLRQHFEHWAAARQMSSLLQAIRLLGNPDAVKHPVHYPQPLHRNQSRQEEREERPLIPVTGVEMEQKSFEWFVKNDALTGPRRTGQFLRPLVNEHHHVAAAIPTLSRDPKSSPPDTRYVPPPPGGGGGGAGGGGAFPPAVASRPAGPELGRKYLFTVKKHDKEGRVLWETEIGGRKYPGFLAVQKSDRARWVERFPVNAREELEIQGLSDPLQLKPPAAS